MEKKMQNDLDCEDCHFYRYDFKHRVPVCSQGKTVVEWEGDYDWETDEFEYGAYRVDNDNNKIECELFRMKVGNKRGHAWRGAHALTLSGDKEDTKEDTKEGKK